MSSHQINANVNAQTHDNLYLYMNTDILLNELLWRADKSTCILKSYIENILSINGFTIKLLVYLTNTGIYIKGKIGGIHIWHISFHLHKQLGRVRAPGALHIYNESNGPNQKKYQLFRVTPVLLEHCKNQQVNHIRFNRGSLYPDEQATFCDNYEDSLTIAINCIQEYFTQKSNPVSLHHNLSGHMFDIHPLLMSIIRTRPTIQRTALTISLKGGYMPKRSRINMDKNGTIRRKKIKNNRTIKNNV